MVRHHEKSVFPMVMARATSQRPLKIWRSRSSRILNLITIFVKRRQLPRELAYNAASSRCWDGCRGKRPAFVSISAMPGQHEAVVPLLIQACIYLPEVIHIKLRGVSEFQVRYVINWWRKRVSAFPRPGYGGVAP